MSKPSRYIILTSALLMGGMLTLTAPARAQQITYDPLILSSCVEAASGMHGARACIGVAAARCMATPDGDTTAGMNECLGAEASQWDDRLNDAYGKLTAQRKADDADLSASGSAVSPAEPALREAQRAWVAWRDAECAYVAAQWQGGTGGGPATSDCAMRLTGERALELELEADQDQPK